MKIRLVLHYVSRTIDSLYVFVDLGAIEKNDNGLFNMYARDTTVTMVDEQMIVTVLCICTLR